MLDKSHMHCILKHFTSTLTTQSRALCAGVAERAMHNTVDEQHGLLCSLKPA